MSMGRTRREFLAALAATPLLQQASIALAGDDGTGAVQADRPAAASARDRARAASDEIFLIAHRGGVVDDAHAENSPASIEAAIARRFWMIEVDIRRTRDGQAIAQHDATFARFYGAPRNVADMTWAEIETLRATPGGTRPMRFDELCERCAGRTRLMLDIKGDYPDDFYQGIIDSLRRHRLLDSTYSLSGGRVPDMTKGGVARAVDRKALAAAIAKGEPVASTCFLFELGSVLDEAALRLCREHDVTPVAALNTFRYEQAKVDHWTGAEADARRLRALGIRHFQIDAIYDRYFTHPAAV